MNLVAESVATQPSPATLLLPDNCRTCYKVELLNHNGDCGECASMTPCREAGCLLMSSMHSESGDRCTRHELACVLETTPEDWRGGADTRTRRVRALTLELLEDVLAPLWLRVRREGFTTEINAEIELLAVQAVR